MICVISVANLMMLMVTVLTIYCQGLAQNNESFVTHHNLGVLLVAASCTHHSTMFLGFWQFEFTQIQIVFGLPI